jgi:hypothetical protein
MPDIQFLGFAQKSPCATEPFSLHSLLALNFFVGPRLGLFAMPLGQDARGVTLAMAVCSCFSSR